MEELHVIIEEPESIAEPTPKKRGRPNGSKNKAPDLYTQLMEKMTQMEETFKNQSSTGGDPRSTQKEGGDDTNSTETAENNRTDG